MGRRVLPYGSDAALVETADPAALRGEILRRALPGVTDIVPGARTVLLRWVPGTAPPDLAWTTTWHPAPGAAPAGELVEVPVTYDGPDLHEVRTLTGLTTDEVVGLHTGTEFTVAFCGFVPGFAYLTGLPEVLRIARRGEPRVQVRAGSVGLAGEYTGVYPRATPGGWRLIGRTSTPFWDCHRNPPALLVPGDRVRFVAVPG